jgi:hypothetical protein
MPPRSKSKTPKPKKANPSKAVEIPARLAPVVRALSKLPRVTVEKGWGSSNAALKVRGKIFAMSIGDDLVLKLPKARVDELIDDGAGTRFDPRKDGRVMKEWVVVPPGASWSKLAREAHGFVAAGA